MDGGPVEVIIEVGNSEPFVQSLEEGHGLEAGRREDHGLSLCASQSVSRSAFVHDDLSLVHRQAQQAPPDLHPDRQTHLLQSWVSEWDDTHRKKGRLLKRLGPKGRPVRHHETASYSWNAWTVSNAWNALIAWNAWIALCSALYDVSCLQRRKKTTKGHRVIGEKEGLHLLSHTRAPWILWAPQSGNTIP